MFYLNSHGVGAHLIQQKLIELLKTILQQDRPLKNCLTLKVNFLSQNHSLNSVSTLNFKVNPVLIFNEVVSCISGILYKRYVI